MIKPKWLRALVVTALITSCTKTPSDINGIDLHAWREDKDGCQGIRSSSVDTLAAQKKVLLGRSEMEIVDALGKPDEQELYKRNQKFYRYLLYPGKTCQPASVALPHDSLKMVIRFNAVGLAKEITFE